MTSPRLAPPAPETPGGFWKLIRQPHFSPYKVYIRRELKFAVLLNPKVGSTAFREILVEGMERAEKRPLLGPWWPLNRTRRFTTAPLGDFIHAFSHQDEYDFRCFVRNPYARLVSAWNDKIVKGFHSPEYARSMKSLVPEIRRFAGQAGLPGTDEAAPIPFPTFLSYVESQPEGYRNQHWDTQRSVLLTRHIRYTRAYQMETDFISGMAETLGKAGIDPAWVAEKLRKPANASGPVKEKIFNPEIAKRVHQLYACDFELFGYDPDSWNRY